MSCEKALQLVVATGGLSTGGVVRVLLYFQTREVHRPCHLDTHPPAFACRKHGDLEVNSAKVTRLDNVGAKLV